MPNVELIADGKVFGGWKTCSVDRGIEHIAGSFNLGVSAFAPDGAAATALRDSTPVTVRMDGETVITGFIDEKEIAHSASEHSITVLGRDATGDLVDSSALPAEWINQSMLAIAQQLVKPFGIRVTAPVNVGSVFANWSVEPGETVYANLERMARHRGVLLLSDGQGGLVLSQPGTAVVGTALRLGENILIGRLQRSCQQRFRDYHVLGSSQRDDFNEPDQATTPHGKAFDHYLRRHRINVCVYEDANASIDALNHRAAWQARVNASQAQRVVITVAGWTHADGLWQPNTRVVVDDPKLGLNNVTLLIVSVRFTQGIEGGTVTELTLAPPDAFMVQAIPEEIAL